MNLWSNPKLFIQILLLSGLVSFSGCKTAPIQSPQAYAIPPRLIEPLEFDGFAVSQISSPEAAKRFMSEKIQGFGTYYGDATDTNGKDITITHTGYDFLQDLNGVAEKTETVQQYIDADKQKFFAHSTLDMLAQNCMDRDEAELEFMAKAQPAQHSNLTGRYFMDLPCSILVGSMDGSEEKELKRDGLRGERVKDYAKPGQTLRLINFKFVEGVLTFSDSVNEIDYRVRELARGDVDGDGNEDALIEVGWHTQGTLGGSFTEVVTRNGLDHELKFLGTAGSSSAEQK